MKKLVSLVFVGLMIMMCAACGGPKEETAVCTLEPITGVAYEITFEAIDDIVQTMTQVTTVTLTEFPEEEVKLLKDNLDAYQEVYKNYKGVQYSSEIKGDMMYETIVIDMTNADTLESLRENDLLPIEGDANKISLQKTMKQLESVDWKVELK